MNYEKEGIVILRDRMEFKDSSPVYSSCEIDIHSLSGANIQMSVGSGELCPQ